ncbi:hypothetical protein HDV57DRAFT_492130 [Trichoderma longibrachiatum]|uniref:Uncharacterized protein n=1 Tax=Trichoderma longibrachiatum ATCC 18648 TaxID=983965 RepID=A0A2T4C2U4_TRILO|nr:hypothetical protein M440DRAFT_1262444 [Trichoderma longibrachiatum ATCC 18648]
MNSPSFPHNLSSHASKQSRLPSAPKPQPPSPSNQPPALHSHTSYRQTLQASTPALPGRTARQDDPNPLKNPPILDQWNLKNSTANAIDYFSQSRQPRVLPDPFPSLPSS